MAAALKSHVCILLSLAVRFHMRLSRGFLPCAILASFLATPCLAGTFSLDKASYQEGEGIVFTWTREAAEPAAKRDWVGIYRPEQTPGNVSSTSWVYLNGTQTPPSQPIRSGSTQIASTSLAPGAWKAHFLADDGYKPIHPPIDFTIGSPEQGKGNAPVSVVPRLPLIHAVVGSAYSAKTAAAFWDPDPGDRLSFAKISGPDWIIIAADGTVSGTPTATNQGKNLFVIRASDPSGKSADGLAEIQVFAQGAAWVEQVRVMTFNVWVGSGNVSDGSRKGLHAILKSGADLVGIQENQSAASKWATELGWHYVQTSDNAILSKYPIVASTGGVEATILLADEPRQEIILRSVHLTAFPYGPYDACLDGAPLATILARETSSGRVGGITSALNALKGKLAAADTTPLIVLGDFNCPSHLDWTVETASTHCGYIVDWPVTQKLVAAGFLDSYRIVHPNLLAQPGSTWSPVFSRNGTKPEPQDRIDMIHYLGKKLLPLDSRVFTLAVEKQDSGYQQNTWPSDHAAVLSDFLVLPVDADADGLADAWETSAFGSPSVQDGTGDPDGDGSANLVEYAFGGDPKQPDAAQPVSLFFDRGKPVLRFTTPRSLTFEIEQSSNLQEWIPANLTSSSRRWTAESNFTHTLVLTSENSLQSARYLRLRIKL